MCWIKYINAITYDVLKSRSRITLICFRESQLVKRKESKLTRMKHPIETFLFETSFDEVQGRFCVCKEILLGIIETLQVINYSEQL